jgi:hypothetical protein
VRKVQKSRGSDVTGKASWREWELKEERTQRDRWQHIVGHKDPGREGSGGKRMTRGCSWVGLYLLLTAQPLVARAVQSVRRAS